MSAAWQQKIDREHKQIVAGVLVVTVCGMVLAGWHYYRSLNYFEDAIAQNIAEQNAEAVVRQAQQMNNPPASLFEQPGQPQSSASDYVKDTESSQMAPATSAQNQGTSTDIPGLSSGVTSGNGAAVSQQDVAQAEAYLKSIGIQQSMIDSFSPEERVQYATDAKQAMGQMTSKSGLTPQQATAMLELIQNKKPIDQWTSQEIRDLLTTLGVDKDALAKMPDDALRKTFADVYNKALNQQKTAVGQ